MKRRRSVDRKNDSLMSDMLQRLSDIGQRISAMNLLCFCSQESDISIAILRVINV